MKTLRLRCTCGRNLADVTRDPYNHDYTPDKLTVMARPSIGSERGAEAVYEHPRRSNTDRRVLTYTWRCRCGSTVTMRHERISALWSEHAGDPARTVIAYV